MTGSDDILLIFANSVAVQNTKQAYHQANHTHTSMIEKG